MASSLMEEVHGSSASKLQTGSEAVVVKGRPEVMAEYKMMLHGFQCFVLFVFVSSFQIASLSLLMEPSYFVRLRTICALCSELWSILAILGPSLDPTGNARVLIGLSFMAFGSYLMLIAAYALSLVSTHYDLSFLVVGHFSVDTPGRLLLLELLVVVAAVGLVLLLLLGSWKLQMGVAGSGGVATAVLLLMMCAIAIGLQLMDVIVNKVPFLQTLFFEGVAIAKLVQLYRSGP